MAAVSDGRGLLISSDEPHGETQVLGDEIGRPWIPSAKRVDQLLVIV